MGSGDGRRECNIMTAVVLLTTGVVKYNGRV
jgi:hypothetical protein